MFQSAGGFRNIPPVTKNLIIVNVIIWLAMILFPSQIGNFCTNHLGLHFIGSALFNPVQVVTYMFMHDTSRIFHILFNMFTLWMFGRVLEQVWGSKRFLIFYLVCGIGAALVQEGVWALIVKHEYIDTLARVNGITYEHMAQIVNQDIAAGGTNVAQGMAMLKNSLLVVGASGAVYGLLLGFAFVFPDLPLYLFFIPVPIKAKYMVIGYGVIEFFLGVSGGQPTVAHFAHLGGMIFGLIMLLYWKKNGTLHGGRFY